MSSPDPAKNQARKLLQTICNCLLPLIQGADGQTIVGPKEIDFGVEADEFATELEKFISGVISRSRPRGQNIAIEATLTDWLDNFEGANWLWEIVAAPEDDMAIAVSSREVNHGRSPADESMVEHHAVPQSMPLGLDYGVHELLQNLQRRVTQKMPIRLLCFEPHNGKLKISLLDRAEVYDYLAPKLQADYIRGPYQDWNLEKKAKYAILSHTWTRIPGELTYGDWYNGSLDDTHPKYQKLVNFCRTAWEDYGLTLGWIDTVCINKASSSELDESIRSMYAWYRNAEVCITYLAGTNVLSDMHNDPWFSRGWTFQELVAPRNVKFYNKDWNQLSNRKSSVTDNNNPLILTEISLATTMTKREVVRDVQISISRRMQLAAKRQVTREEDIAYCLMGIFDVSISTAYGEGAERAFFRLVEEIFRSTKDVSDIFNWAVGTTTRYNRLPVTSLLPWHPSNYLNRSSNEKLRPWRPIEPLTLTHLGLRTPILLMPAVPISELVMDHQPIGDYHATISIDSFFEVPKYYHLLDKRFSGPEGLFEYLTIYDLQQISTLTFGSLNVEEQGTTIHIPKTCLAVLLQSIVESKYNGVVQEHSPGYNKMYTRSPIVFDLQKTGNNTDNEDKHYYELKRSELVKHGMELVTLYL